MLPIGLEPTCIQLAFSRLEGERHTTADIVTNPLSAYSK